MLYVDNLKFENIDFNAQPLDKKEYEQCSFVGSLFYGVNIGERVFVDCEFVRCDFSMCAFESSALRGCRFVDCKMVGSNFMNAAKVGFSVEFVNSKLDMSIFVGQSMLRTKFNHCSVVDCDFSEVNLSLSLFEGCDLSGATFSSTNLERVDFRSSYGYSISPNSNRVRGAKFSRFDAIGLLDEFGVVVE